jgi:hypothetical protein
MNKIADKALLDVFTSDARLSRTKTKGTNLSQTDRKYALIELFGKEDLQKEAIRRGVTFKSGQSKYVIKDRGNIEFVPIKEIPVKFYRDLEFKTRPEFSAFLKKNKIVASKQKSLRDLKEEIEIALEREQKKVFDKNLLIDDLDGYIREVIPYENEHFSIVLKSLEFEFGENPLQIFQHFKSGRDSDKYKKFLNDMKGGIRVLTNYEGLSIQIPEDKFLGIFNVKVFNYGGCSLRNGKINFQDGKYTLKCYSFKMGDVSCFYKVINAIHKTRYRNSDPVKLEHAQEFIKSKGYDTKIYTMDDEFKNIEPNSIFLKDNHFYLVLDVHQSEKIKIKSEVQKQEIRNYLFYDIETIKDLMNPFQYSDEGGSKTGHCLKARLLAFEYCLNGDKSRWYKDFYYGYDCIDRFLEFLRSHQSQRFNIYAHNGSRFDHYFCVGKMDNLQHRKIKLIGKEIFTCKYYNHSFKDTCKLLPFPLEKLCNDFKTEIKKKTSCKSLGLTSYQLCEVDDEKMEEDQAVKDAYIDYCITDVTSLRLVFFKFRETMLNLDKNLDITTNKTIGSLAKKYLDPPKKIKERLEKFIDNDTEKNNFVRRSVYGGISYSIANRLGEPYRTDKAISGLDVNSLYPWALVNSRYPCDESNWTTDINDIEKSFGFMEVSNIVFKNKGLNLIPYKNHSGTLQWWYHDKKSPNKERQVINIQFFLNDANIESYTFHKALTTKNSIHGVYCYGDKVCELYKIKQKQDQYAKYGDKQYNEALRTCVKLILNSYYGKCVENYSKHKKIVWTDDGENNMLGQCYTTTNSDEINNLLVVGSIVLSTSKVMVNKYMNCVPKNSDIIAIETDGFYFENRALEEFTSNMNAIEDDTYKFNLKLGGLKLEKTTLDGLYSYFIGKKNYFMCCHSDYGDDNVIVDCKSDHRLKFRVSDMRMSGIPVYQYKDGLYQCVINPSDYEKMYHGSNVIFKWSKLARDLEHMKIGQVQQTRERGFLK